ncbi:hypothetical protein, partial [Mycobacterium gordonae]|uniref:hypothetical protein n=1 Tax=Mycobacterium gordonae TaxID=1778 RepID=UPI000AB159B2
LRELAVDDEDRFAVDEGQSRALRAEVRRRRFARHREPLDLHVVIDGEKTGDGGGGGCMAMAATAAT